MELTVEQVLAMAPFARTRVVAGHSGLGRVIRSVNVMEVPDIADFVRPKELLLTTGFPLRNNPEAMRSLIPTLASHDVAALAIKLNRYVHEIPQEMVEAADRFGLPLLELPPDASFNEYINPLLGEILNRQAVMLKRSEEIHANFTRVLLEGGGFNGLIRALAEFTGCEVALYDSERPILSTRPDTVGALPAVAAIASDSDVAAPAETPLGMLIHTEPVVVGWGVCGYVTLWGQAQELNEIDRLAVQHAATVLGIEFQRQESIRETERRYAAQFLSEFLEGKLENMAEIMRRAETLSLPLHRTDGLMAIHVDGTDMHADSNWRKRLGGHLGTMRRLLATIDGVCRSEEVAHILFEHDGLFVLLVQPGDVSHRGRVLKQLERIGQRISAGVQGAFSHLVPVVGIGRYYGDVARLPESYQEARRAVVVGRKVRRTVVQYDDLGVYRILAATPDNELHLFVHDILGALIAYDREHDADLIHTLTKYLESGRNVKQTAEALYVHYNTVRYRIERIERLLGGSLEDPDRQLALHVGLKAWAIVEAD